MLFRSLDNSIGLGVVGRDADVVDTIVVSEDLERGNVRSAVVRYNGFYCTVAAENGFEDEFGYSYGIFGVKHAVFRPSRKGTMCLCYIREAIGLRHPHCIHMDNSEQATGLRHHRWNMRPMNVADLAYVA